MSKVGKAIKLKRKQKDLSRQTAMLSKVAGQVYSDKAKHDAALEEAEAQGWLNGMHTAANLAAEARTIAVARKAIADRIEMGR